MPITVIFFDLGETLVTSGRQWLPSGKHLLEALKQQGYRLGVISNTSGLTNRQAILDLLPTDFDLAAFEANLVLFSSEVHKEKPGRAVFEEAVGSLHEACKRMPLLLGERRRDSHGTASRDALGPRSD